MKVLVVGLSPALDQVLVLGESVEEGKIFRPNRRYRSAGSKSLNVARFLSRLGHEVHLIGFFGDYIGQWLLSQCCAEGVNVVPIHCNDDNRINTTVIGLGKEYVISDRWQEISSDELTAFQKTYGDLVDSFPFVIFAGSVAKGVDLVSYENMIATAKEAGANIIVDAKPSFLKVALPYAWLIKVNQFEAQGLNVEQFRGNLGVTCERSGAFFRSADGFTFKAELPQVPCINSVGAGDVFLSYLLHVYWAGQDWREALLVSSAAASSSVATEAIGEIDVRLFEELKRSVSIKEVGLGGFSEGSFYGRFC
ncbi:MAG TPA: 1-phosphofructokinase [Coprothermobacter sp.]|nr:1-phosphofructokinase [Coprothermobacter sp.]